MIERYPTHDRAAWLALRKDNVNASEVAALFGVSSFTTPLQMWAEHTGRAGTKGDNIAMKAGRIMESAIAQAVREEHPDWDVVKCPHYIRDPKLRIGATPDYVRSPMGAPIECKFVQPRIYDSQWFNGPPLMYVLQTLVQIYLLDADMGYVACMIDNRAKDVVLYDVPRNDAAWNKIQLAVALFWDDVASDRMPKPNYDNDGEALRALFPANATLPPLDMTSDNRMPELLATRETLKAGIADATKQVEAIDAEIIDKLRGAPEAKANGYRLTYKAQTRKAYEVKESTYSVLRVVKTKEEKEL